MMISKFFSKAIAQPVTGLALFSFIVAADPLCARAQLPVFSGQPKPQPNATPSPPIPTNSPFPSTFTTSPPTPTNSSANPPVLPTFNLPPESSFPQTQPPSPEVSAPYFLGGGDVIRIEILSLPQYSGQYSLPADGGVSLPLIGTIYFNGLTVEEATATLTKKYKNYLKRPVVTFNLVLARPLHVLVAGEVRHPGSFLMPLKVGVGESPGFQYPKLTEALQLAEGLTLAANMREVEIRRPKRGGGREILKINLWELANNGSQQDLALRDGDTIFVPAMTTVNLAEIKSLTSATFSIDATRAPSLSVVGEVTRPGTYIVVGVAGAADRSNRLPTVSKAIQQAGGITPSADIRRIEIRRLTRNGTGLVFNVDMWQLLQTGDANQDTLLQDGDTLIVPTATAINPAEATKLASATFSPDNIQVSVVGEVGAPGLIRLPPNAPLNQAVLAAGGFKEGRANKGSVDLLRVNSDGTVAKRTIPVNFAQGINEEGNPLLRNNDIIVVGSTELSSFYDTFGNPIPLFVSLFTLPLRILDVIKALGF